MKTPGSSKMAWFVLLAVWPGLAGATQQGTPENPLAVLVCYPGGPIQARDAKPAMDSMLRVIEATGAWPKGGLTSQFTSRVEECRKLMATQNPHFAILSIGLYLEHKAKNHLVPVAQPNIKGRTTDTYRVLVKKGKYKSIADLKGKSLGGTLLTEPVFLRKVVFKNKLDPQKHFKLQTSRRALRALRGLHKGKLDAVMVNELQYKSLASLPFSGQLESIFASDPIPLVGLVANSKRTSGEERARLTQSLSAMCTHAKGKELCEMFGVEAFVPADSKTYEQVMKLWKAP